MYLKLKDNFPILVGRDVNETTKVLKDRPAPRWVHIKQGPTSTSRLLVRKQMVLE